MNIGMECLYRGALAAYPTSNALLSIGHRWLTYVTVRLALPTCEQVCPARQLTDCISRLRRWQAPFHLTPITSVLAKWPRISFSDARSRVELLAHRDACSCRLHTTPAAHAGRRDALPCRWLLVITWCWYSWLCQRYLGGRSFGSQVAASRLHTHVAATALADTLAAALAAAALAGTTLAAAACYPRPLWWLCRCCCTELCRTHIRALE